jgi:hypothetical protein
MGKTAAGLKLIGLSERLREIESARAAGLVKPVQAGSLREKALCEGVATLARYFDVTLKPINAIDSNGELPIVSQGVHVTDLVGAPFSRDFCDVLNTVARPRCGMPGTEAVMDPDHSNWCRINHFEAEKMIHHVVEAMS